MFRSETFRVFAMAILILVAVFTTGCNPVSFEKIDPLVKSKLVSGQGVFTPPGRAPAESNDGSSDPYGGTNPSETNTGSTDPYGSGGSSSPVSGGAFPVIGGTGGSTQPVSGGSTQPSTGGSTQPTSGSSTSPVVGGSNPPTNNNSTSSYPPLPFAPTQIPLFFICSDDETEAKTENLRTSSSLKVEVVQYKNGVETGRCIEDGITASQLISSKKITFNKCQPKGQMITKVTKPNDRIVQNETVSSSDHFTIDFISDNVSLLSWRIPTVGAKIHLLYDINGLPSSVAGFSSTAANQTLCDDSGSPLFVDMRSAYEKTQQFSLKAPWAGVTFDILGKNADNAAHTPYRMSWFESAAMAYITLPNKYGQVNGIDEMFGDNTLGPDGKFAPNGYAALAKYDLNKDEVIDIEDAVYAKLKIWQDRNLDGKAEASELKSLADAKIEVIDLRYDSDFSEQDIYGNTIKYKSVVKMANGEYRLMFDIWFELNLYKARQRYLELSSL